MQRCEYFALCDRPAEGTVAHPILGDVPCCQRCADRVEVELQRFIAEHFTVIHITDPESR